MCVQKHVEWIMLPDCVQRNTSHVISGVLSPKPPALRDAAVSGCNDIHELYRWARMHFQVKARHSHQWLSWNMFIVWINQSPGSSKILKKIKYPLAKITSFSRAAFYPIIVILCLLSERWELQRVTKVMVENRYFLPRTEKNEVSRWHW